MPYKVPEQKRVWEWRHHFQRLARRRELRQIEAARKDAQTEAPKAMDSGAGLLLLPVVGGVALAFYNPKLAMGAGGLTLLVAALHKKDWRWWIAGVLILAVGLFFQWTSQSAKK